VNPILKEEIITECFTILAQKEKALKEEIANLRDGIANDSKSSMGDKYETSREMSQQEINRLEQQQALVKQQIFQLKNISTNINPDKINVGSLVQTSIGYFFIATALGEVKINKLSVYVISPVAPIAKLLLLQPVGSEIFNNNKQIEIIAII
jgi:hypothetical protein